jgi:hypothetical protein
MLSLILEKSDIRLIIPKIYNNIIFICIWYYIINCIYAASNINPFANIKKTLK